MELDKLMTFLGAARPEAQALVLVLIASGLFTGYLLKNKLPKFDNDQIPLVNGALGAAISLALYWWAGLAPTTGALAMGWGANLVHTVTKLRRKNGENTAAGPAAPGG